MNTRSMASGSALSLTGTRRKAEETPVREFEERHFTDRYMEDFFEDVPYIDPTDNEQNDNIDSDNNNYQKTPQSPRFAAVLLRRRTTWVFGLSSRIVLVRLRSSEPCETSDVTCAHSRGVWLFALTGGLRIRLSPRIQRLPYGLPMSGP